MRKKGLVEKVVIGNPSDKDFTANDLPANRWQLMGFLLRNRLRQLYCNHLLTALFFIPLLAWWVLTMGYAELTFSSGTPLEQLTRLPYYTAVVYGTALPFWMLAFYGLSGGMFVTRKLCWGEPVVLSVHFKQALKQSGRQFAFTGLVTGVVWMLVAFATRWLTLYSLAYGADFLTATGTGCLVVVSVVAGGITMFAVSMSSLYNVSFARLYLNSFKLYFSTFLRSSAVLLCSIALPLVLCAIPLVLTQLIAVCMIFVVQVGWFMLLATLVCHSAFDKYINAKNYPDFYKKGLRYGKVTENKPAVEVSSEDVNDSDETEQDFEKLVRNAYEDDDDKR